MGRVFQCVLPYRAACGYSRLLLGRLSEPDDAFLHARAAEPGVHHHGTRKRLARTAGELAARPCAYRRTAFYPTRTHPPLSARRFLTVPKPRLLAAHRRPFVA